LGLAIVKQIVLAHGGEVSVDSDPVRDQVSGSLYPGQRGMRLYKKLLEVQKPSKKQQAMTAFTACCFLVI